MLVERAAALFRLGLGWSGWLLVGVIGLVLLPLLWRIATVWAADSPHWSSARWDSSGLAPDPATTPEPGIQFYAARTWGWRGILGVHTWVIYKPRGAAAYACYDVVGCGVSDGQPALRLNRLPHDAYSIGNR